MYRTDSTFLENINFDTTTQRFNRAIGLMSRVFVNGLGFNPRSSHTKDSKNGI